MAPAVLAADDKVLPKATALPAVLIVTKSKASPLASPTIMTPRSSGPLDMPSPAYPAAVRSPKSVAFPVVSIVTKSITLDPSDPSNPPANNPLCLRPLESAEMLYLPSVRFPKSIALPGVLTVMCSIVSVSVSEEFVPPAINTLSPPAEEDSELLKLYPVVTPPPTNISVCTESIWELEIALG